MIDHATKTIADLRSLASELTSTANRLEIIFADREPISTPVPVVSKSKPKPKPAANGHTTQRSKELIEFARALIEPFSASDLATAGKLITKTAHSNIWRWKDRGWVKQVGYGKFERTAKFPKVESDQNPIGRQPESHVHIPGFDPEPEGTVAERLEKALKDRDNAIAAGQTRLAKILQDKVDKLTSELSKTPARSQ